MRPRGVFLSFEGVDGSGKTTQLERLAAKLRQAGREIVIAQEPGGTRVGGEIRRLLLDAANTDLRPIPELLLYFASRAQNVEEVIRPAIEEGKLVLVDRFTDATIAYQGYGRQLGVDAVRAVESVACGGVKPDLTLWLDLDPAEAVRRALERNEEQSADESRMERESREFYLRVRKGYREMWQAEPARIRRIDALGSVDEVARQIDEIVFPFLSHREIKKGCVT